MKHALAILTVLMLCSCASIEPTPETFPPGYTGPAILEATPWSTVLVSGSTGYIYVKVMDENKNPLPGQTVTASFEPGGDDVAYFERDMGNPVTNEKGDAVFYVVGTGYQGNTKLNFRCGDASTSVYVWTRGNSPFEPPS